MTDVTLSAQSAQRVITAATLVLRPLQPSDAGPIEMFAGDARVAKMTTSIPHPLPPGATDALLNRAQAEDRSEDVWAIEAISGPDTNFMGLISLNRLDAHQSEIGYWVSPAFWNTGTASEAVAALIEDNPLGNKTIFASVFQDNPASARVLTNCGFDYIGDAETFSVARGSTVPTWTYIRKLD